MMESTFFSTPLKHYKINNKTDKIRGILAFLLGVLASSSCNRNETTSDRVVVKGSIGVAMECVRH